MRLTLGEHINADFPCHFNQTLPLLEISREEWDMAEQQLIPTMNNIKANRTSIVFEAGTAAAAAAASLSPGCEAGSNGILEQEVVLISRGGGSGGGAEGDAGQGDASRRRQL